MLADDPKSAKLRVERDSEIGRSNMKTTTNKTSRPASHHEKPAPAPKGKVSRRGLSRFCGAWKDDRSAEEIVRDIYEKRSWRSEE
jgi:hypothetical protein